MDDRGPRFGAAFWINRTGWPELRDAVASAESAGWDSIWLDDHLLCDEGDELAAKLEGWTTLAALAPTTARVRLGHLVSPVTFRDLGVIAKMATTLDHVSGGRFVLGLGAGWYAREHEAFGIDFGSGVADRLDRLDEAAGLLRRLLDGEIVTHHGRYYDLDRAACAPRPLQARLPILIGGTGRTKTLRTVARVADIWNAYATPKQLVELEEILAAHGAAVGRDVTGIERQVYVNVVVRPSAAAARAAWDEVRAIHDIQPGEDPLHAGGSPHEVAAALRPWVDAGVDEIVAVLRPPWDGETIDRLPEVRAALAGLELRTARE
jgi:alkanesulfonate monooxygenase SsuD/methylene tetrahydromethanopterin reductase-like flavin-dependent oxidoreductase (luciferase family)